MIDSITVGDYFFARSKQSSLDLEKLSLKLDNFSKTIVRKNFKSIVYRYLMVIILSSM